MLVLPGRVPTRCQTMVPRGPVGWGFLVVILHVPSASCSELLGFTRGVVGVVVVLTLGHLLLLDLRGLQPSGVIRFGALNHPTWSRVCIPVFASFTVHVVTVAPRLCVVFSWFVYRAASRGRSAVGLSFMILVFVERCIQRVTSVLGELLVIRSHSDGMGFVSGAG